MDEIAEFFDKLFSSDGFIPRWVCGEWTSFHGWFYIISDFLIWLAYFAIPAVLFYFTTKKKSRFQPIFWWFIAFILLCGLTHIIEVVIFWKPVYRLAAFVKFLTAFVSIATVFILLKYLPAALKFKSPTELEQIIDEKTVDLQILNESLKDEKAKLEHKNKNLEEVQYIVSHNLRSPIGNMQSLVEMCKTDDEGVRSAAMQKVDQVLQQMQHTVDELNDVVVSTKQEETDKLVNLPEIFARVKSILSHKIDQSGAEFEVNFEVDEIIFPEAYVESIFQNFISNGIKYSKKSQTPRIKISSTKPEEGQCKLVFTDNGRGIDLEANGDKLFKFGKTFHKNKDARGVGLFITKRQIESRGGRIEVESKVGEGSTFTIYL